MAKKEKSGIEIIESAEVLQQELGKAESFFNQNKNILYIIAGVVIAAVAGVLGYKYFIKQQNQEAQVSMYDSVYYFESDSLELALNGTGGNAGLLEVADSYGSSPAGNLAKFYVGVAYMKQGKFDEAIEYLSDFSADDIVIQGRAYALLGDAYLEKGDAQSAISQYQKAVDYKSNKQMTPAYLMKLATAYEVAGDKQGAIEAYGEVVDNYSTSTEYLAATKYKAKLEAEAGN
ncbi:tetratricopeptide repeat protein [Jiulongibacter sediminis]|uniref:Cytochrome C biosynthesis protein n=1 Tax=Jiulongibacter sediminis TaxID=1605367 RepID=A0A0P7C527_9BACT|nr:tetratricopeptide repeat protein [Jiulongibacter sediminis]KPM48354.1 cytochrome C biosynthesis protein [Jiulongibacter sediminis]TBX24891.1 cytochrome C biosynthesis protein [Jiulongibacter sediminis]